MWGLAPTSKLISIKSSSSQLLQTLRRTQRRYIASMADSSQLIERLYVLSQTNKKLVKASEYNAPADKSITVTSWKMNEFKYYDIPSPFPTLARGLFTTTNGGEAEGSDSRYRVVARGYDKFFNIGEVPWTNVRYIVPSFSQSDNPYSGEQSNGTPSHLIL